MSDQQNKNQYSDPMDENRSIWIFYHLFMALLYGGIGILIGVFWFD